MEIGRLSQGHHGSIDIQMIVPTGAVRETAANISESSGHAEFVAELVYELNPAPKPPILPPHPLIMAIPGVSGRKALTNA
jgi:hypothetical protein